MVRWDAVTLDVNNNPVTISKYQVWPGATPYFDPVLPAPAETTGLEYRDSGVLGVVDAHYYVVRAVSTAALSSANSNRTGEFTFSLTKGSN